MQWVWSSDETLFHFRKRKKPSLILVLLQFHFLLFPSLFQFKKLSTLLQLVVSLYVGDLFDFVVMSDAENFNTWTHTHNGRVREEAKEHGIHSKKAAEEKRRTHFVEKYCYRNSVLTLLIHDDGDDNDDDDDKDSSTNRIVCTKMKKKQQPNIHLQI